MLLVSDSIKQIKTNLPTLTIVYSLLLALLILIVAIGESYNIPISQFTRDPAAITHTHPFNGVLSNIGILFWCSTVAICFFVSALQIKQRNVEFSRFLFFSGLLTTLLLIDDFFMFHEFIFPIALHIPEKLVYLGYLTLISIYFIKFRSVIFRTEYALLFVACFFFALSLICDVALPQKGIEFLFEDGFKLFGIITWFIYFIRTCFATSVN